MSIASLKTTQPHFFVFFLSNKPRPDFFGIWNKVRSPERMWHSTVSSRFKGAAGRLVAHKPFNSFANQPGSAHNSMGFCEERKKKKKKTSVIFQGTGFEKGELGYVGKVYIRRFVAKVAGIDLQRGEKERKRKRKRKSE